MRKLSGPNHGKGAEQVRISTHPLNSHGTLTHITFRLQPLHADDAVPLDFLVPARRDGEISARALADAMRRMVILLDAIGLAAAERGPGAEVLTSLTPPVRWQEGLEPGSNL